MHVLRTPDERFADLPDWPYAPRWMEIPGLQDGGMLRVHFVDEGPRDAPPVLLLHGEPTWAYLYRKMIPILTAAGHRVVAPDLVGFGRSDKLADPRAYTYERHVGWTRGLIEALDLRDVVLVCQDWGGLIGLRLVAEHPERFTRVVAANTFLPTGDRAASEAFLRWQRFSQEVAELPVGGILQSGTTTDLPPEVLAAYEAPFVDEAYKAGARSFPMLVPTSPDHPGADENRRAWEILRHWDKPFLTAFSDGDPITAGGDRAFQAQIPGTRGQPHTTIRGAGHFLQEDRGEELARVVVDWLAG